MDAETSDLLDGRTAGQTDNDARPPPAAVPPTVRTVITLAGAPAKLTAAFRALGGDPAERTATKAVYFDTGDRRLWTAGYSLAVFETGGVGRLVLTDLAGLGFAKRFWASAAPTPTPDPDLLPAEAPRAPFTAILPGELLPRFSLKLDRARTEFLRDDARLELTLDRGAMTAIGDRLPIHELRLRLLAGPRAAVIRTAEAIAADYGLTLSLASYSGRGMVLAGGDPPKAAKARWPDFAPDVTVEAALREVLATTAAHVFGNLAIAAAGENPAGVHQLRVALRRLRAALSLFKGLTGPEAERLNDGARQALRRLGPARDLDVFLAETAPPVAAGLGDPAALGPLLKRAQKARQDAYRDVRRMMTDRVFLGFLADLLVAAEADGLPVADGGARLRPMAAKLLKRRLKKTRRAGDGFALLPNPARHEARIALKKLRYATGYFQSLFPGPATAAYRKRMSRLQDALGRLNDADVAAALVDRLAGRDPQAQIAGALIKGWHACRLAAAEPDMVQAWEGFAEAKPFWKE